MAPFDLFVPWSMALISGSQPLSGVTIWMRLFYEIDLGLGIWIHPGVGVWVVVVTYIRPLQMAWNRNKYNINKNKVWSLSHTRVLPMPAKRTWWPLVFGLRINKTGLLPASTGLLFWRVGRGCKVPLVPTLCETDKHTGLVVADA